jgi:AraC-like DNA-binding protein
MTRDLSREVSLNDVAQSLNLSASRLRHLFKAEMGLSPARYLKARRLKEAKELLETSFLNVKQVMLKVGYNHRAHFVGEFKKSYGLSPSQYRVQFLLDQQVEEVPKLM